MSRSRPPRRWRGTVRRRLTPLAARAARRMGFDVIPADYNSPVPDLASLRPEDWARRSALHGVAFDSTAQLAFAERELADAIREFRPPRRLPPGGGFFLENGWYESVDAELLYAMLRWLRPRRVVELGSGWSTLLICEAVQANERDGAEPASYEVYDPFAGDPVHPGLAGLTALHRTRVQDLPVERVASLDAGDVLFVDTSHTVKLGGDVNHVVLELLPRLAPGVAVHFHDIWLPFEYHRWLIEGLALCWNEQYLLQAFLAENDRWEVLLGAQALARNHPDRLRALVPSYRGDNHPTAFWIRQVR